MPRHIGVGADPHAGRTIAPKHAILLKHGHSRMLALSPARRAPPHVKGARHVQRGGRFLMCSACAMPKKESCLLPRVCTRGRQLHTPYADCANHIPPILPCTPKPHPVTSNSPVTAAALPQTDPVSLNHSRREHHCQAGHFSAYAKNRSSENSDDLFLVSAPTYFPGPLPAKYLRRK